MHLYIVYPKENYKCYAMFPPKLNTFPFYLTYFYVHPQHRKKKGRGESKKIQVIPASSHICL